MSVIDYKCPSCGGGMVFDSGTGMLSCPSCGRQEDITQMPDPLARNVFAADEAAEYHCHSCGAVIMTDGETAATSCSFCGSSVVLGDRLVGKLAPALVIPFKVSKNEAVQAFRKWCRNGLLTPGGFMHADRIKSITGMYVPFWLYDLHNNIQVQATGTKVRVYRSGDYEVTETQHFDIYREIVLNYVQVPADASEKMNDELMDKLEPFPYDQLKPFKSPYLAGYMAEKYQYTDADLLPRVKEKISAYIEAYIRSTLSGYTTVNVTGKQIDTLLEKAEYALLPVWMLHYGYKKTDHMFAMNGQTGKVVGKPPISAGKVSAWAAGVFAVSFLSMKLIALALGGGFW
ncbi:TFIIB-type zinc ribbon-containing protein [Paenibacillus athensensis]|uniref:TFIIB-type domain-containing protein n=1 Tax=Paenibacillus athensensis TaxID=1967502 RepID=A0A4Y8Q0Q6_9BACL|nr:TFIIB-type zinc ribbon-containing protein [Paenibacillus athensensis]MCD1258567.1 TFIIB-type zinc ribbon-containing protein [Paenibacillus athensensis]